MIRLVNSKEYQLPDPPAWVESWFIRWRFWIFGLFCLAIIAIEYFVEPLLSNDPLSSESIEYIVFFIVIVSFGLLAEILLRTIVAKSSAVELLEIKHELSIRLQMASDWNKLTDLILAFCEAVVNPDRVVLLLHTESGGFEAAAQSQTVEYLETHEGTGASTGDDCIRIEGAATALDAIRDTSDTPDELASLGYCLPLKMGWRIIAKLIFYLPRGSSLSERQINIFKNCSPDLAIALTTAQMRKEQADLLIEQARSVQRHEISRNLHDALGQKLIYLRFKLDQFISSNKKGPLTDIYYDLEQMLVVANESCELVRGTLAVLNSSGSPSLLKVLMEHSRLIIKRTQWDLTFDEIGSPQMLSPETLQQILYLFGEVLSNVERHAAAQKVAVNLIWSETELIIRMADNGRGFKLAEAQKEGHYGLKYMHERVEMLSGRIELHSAPGKGTRLTIQLPINDNRDGASAQDLHEFVIALNVD
ncbi:MAG: sensor histidine kinase [Anaerolineales bacterium]